MKQRTRILIVEDEAMIALSLEMELTKAGYEVDQCLARGEDAVNISLDVTPDCILMDIGLAGEINGIEAAQQIQMHTNIPIIFITGYPDKEIEERAKQLNPLGYFIKPIRVLALKPLLDSIQEKT
jgi:two-component system, response regulator PdtaR